MTAWAVASALAAGHLASANAATLTAPAQAPAAPAAAARAAAGAPAATAPLAAAAPAVVVDANGQVVGPLVWAPNDSYHFYGDVVVAYRVGAEVARVGFLASKDWRFGVLSGPYRAANLAFTTPDCSGQAYSAYGLPKDYLPYAPVFVAPPITMGERTIPARVMRQTAATVEITDRSGTADDGSCVANTYPKTRKHFVIEVVGEFPFKPPFAIR